MSDISVVMPVFNGEQYLAEAIESVHSQTLQPAELIVVDDGSTDQSANVATSLGAKVLRCTHAGNGQALNKGVEAATGSILAFLDSDDLWPPARCEVLSALLAADSTLDAVAGLVDEFVSPELTAGERAGLRRPHVGAPSVQANVMLIRHSAFDVVGPFQEELQLGTGLDWGGRVSLSAIRLCRTDQVVLLRRLHLHNSGIKNKGERGSYAIILKRRLDRIRREEQGR